MPVEINLYKNENGKNTVKVNCDYCKKLICDFGDGTAYWKAHQGRERELVSTTEKSAPNGVCLCVLAQSAPNPSRNILRTSPPCTRRGT